jgi:mannitol/fructose-specific phosphotransferase system IIA component (Ntr-type)
MLKKFITQNRVQVVDKVASWQDAVELAAGPLLADKSITPRYVEDVLANIDANGPYIVLTEGFALPHAQSKEGSVMDTCMSLLVVNEGVAFSPAPEHRAHVIILLAAVNSSAHMDAMVELVDKLDDLNWLQAMSKASSIQEAFALLS